MRRNGAGFGKRIHKAFAGGLAQSGNNAIRKCPMISSVSASAPVKTSEAAESPPPQTKTDADTDKVGAPQPTILAALPPGQGTRIDQLV